MIKYTNKHLEAIQTQISGLKEFQENIGKLQSPEKEVFWKALKAYIDKTIKVAEENREIICGRREDTDAINGFLEIKFYSGMISACKEILGAVEKTDAVLDSLNERLAESKKSLENIKANIDLQQ